MPEEPGVEASKRRPRNGRRFVLGLASGAVALAGALVVMATTPAYAGIGGTFVPVAMTGSCTLAAGYSSSGSLCAPGIGGNMYIYLPTSGASLTYSFNVATDTNATLTYGIPAGGFVNTVAGTVSLDGGAPVTVNSDLGSFDQTTPNDLALWTSPVLGPGAHTWTITSTGDAVNIYGLWLSQVGVTVPCNAGTTTCSATLAVPSQAVAVTGSKPSPTSASLSVQIATSTLSCANFGYAAPVVTLTDTGLQTGSSVNLTDTVAGLPSKKGVKVCYQPLEVSPPSPALLGKCHGKKFTGACVKSVTENAGSVIAILEVPAGDPRFHIGGEAPVVTGFSPASPKAGKKLNIKGLNLSEITGVTIGGVPVRIIKTAPSKVSVIAPAQAQGTITVTSLAGVASSAAAVTVP